MLMTESADRGLPLDSDSRLATSSAVSRSAAQDSSSNGEEAAAAAVIAAVIITDAACVAEPNNQSRGVYDGCTVVAYDTKQTLCCAEANKRKGCHHGREVHAFVHSISVSEFTHMGYSNPGLQKQPS
jgi:hypothetical protein